jgi:ribosomal protein L22
MVKENIKDDPKEKTKKEEVGAKEKIEKEVKENIKDDPKEKTKKEEVGAKEKIEKEVKPVKKDLAIANAYAIRISPKYAFAICKVILGKSPENAIKRLEEAIKEKRAIPMSSREVAHQKGKGMAGGKFPKKACNELIGIIKQVRANANIAGIENPIITIAKANRASAPFRRGGRKGKRAHIHLEVKDKAKLIRKKK